MALEVKEALVGSHAMDYRLARHIAGAKSEESLSEAVKRLREQRPEPAVLPCPNDPLRAAAEEVLAAQWKGEQVQAAALANLGAVLERLQRTDSPRSPIASDEELARRFWQRFYALSPFQDNRPHEDVTVPLVIDLIAEVRCHALRGSDRPPNHRVNEEASRQETYTYPPCGVSKCKGTIRTMTQDRARKCGACLEKKA